MYNEGVLEQRTYIEILANTYNQTCVPVCFTFTVKPHTMFLDS